MSWWSIFIAMIIWGASSLSTDYMGYDVSECCKAWPTIPKSELLIGTRCREKETTAPEREGAA